MRHIALAAATATGLAAGIAAADPETLRLAIIGSDLAAVQQEIAEGTPIDARFRPFGTPPVALAAIRGEIEIVRYLLRQGADPNSAGFGATPTLAMAVRSCHATAAMVRLLVEAGADVDGRAGAGPTPVMIAIQTGRPDIARELIALGADLSATDMIGDGVLNYAIYYEEPDLVSAALHGGAPVDQLEVLFQTREYRGLGFGADGLPARRIICGR